MFDQKILHLLLSFLFILTFGKRSSAQSISAGGLHNIIICEDGSTMAWGQNGFGQLGIDTFSTMSDIPVVIPNFDYVKDVAAGHYHTVALKIDGSVWTCGRNGSGQLGREGPAGSVFLEIDTLKNSISIASGSDHSLAVRNTGEVWAWGLNNYGQLGNSAIGGGGKRPTKVLGLTNVTAVAAGTYHSLALKGDGTVWAWGINVNGELGDSSGISRQIPVRVVSLHNVVAIGAGISHSIALTSNGEVFTWGDNSNLQFDGPAPSSFSPIKIDSLKNIKSIAGSKGYHSSALDHNGTLFMWGRNDVGQLGIGHHNQPYSPVIVESLPNVRTLATNGYTHSFVVDDSGQLQLWGSNIYGQLGDGTIQDSYLPLIPETSCNVVSATKELENASKISIYPNPFVDELNITSLLNIFNQIQIIDGLGRVVQHVNFSETGVKTVFLSHLASGIHFIKVIDKKGLVEMHRVVKI